MKDFFTTEEVRDSLSSMLTILPGLSRQQTDSGKLASYLVSVLRIVMANARELDISCQHTIGRYGSMFTQIRINLAEPLGTNLELATALFYLFISEFDLSLKNEMNDDLRRFKDFVESGEVGLGSQGAAIVELGQKSLPTAIFKELMGDIGVKSLTEVPALVRSLSDKMTAWTAELNKRQVDVERLQATLDEQRDGYNFVGLYKGFEVLSTAKRTELEEAGTMMRVLGMLMLTPVLLDGALFFSKSELIFSASPYVLATFAVLTFTTTFLFGYFYRVFLRNSQTCKAQLLQIELRKSLCQFIQQYASYTEGIKNKEVLAKFEALVFSPIAYSEDAGVQMFDGFEHLTGFISAVRGKDT